MRRLRRRDPGEPVLSSQPLHAAANLSARFELGLQPGPRPQHLANTRKHRLTPRFLAQVATVLLSGAIVDAQSPGTTSDSSASVWPRVAQEVAPGVVEVETDLGSGSGFLID